MSEEGQAKASPPSRVTTQALDVLLKLEAEQIATLFSTRFNLDLPPILRPLPTELPQLDLHLERLDKVFEMVGRGILHMEAQARLGRRDLRRFLGYGLALFDVYEDREIWTVVLCGPGVRVAPAPIHIEALGYHMVFVLLGNQNGEATLERLRALAASGNPWTEEDRLDLVLLPLMRHKQGTEAVAREGLGLAGALPPDDRQRAMGAILALAYHYEGKQLLDRLVEELMATQTWEERLVDAIERRRAEQARIDADIDAQMKAQGLAQGLSQGRAEGERVLLRRLLERRFGAIPDSLQQRIAALDSDALMALFDRALAAASIDEV
jgi:hypothetical protein